MVILDDVLLRRYRQRTFRLEPGLRLRHVAAARAFVEERGFIFFWPIGGIPFPSLWTATAGDRPVADAHDDPGHITWTWKDQALDKGWWYYAKVLRGKATLIALDVVPAFYALSENYGDPQHDYLDQYRDGLLSYEARVIYETLLERGPLDTVNLRRLVHMTGSGTGFETALTHLQRDFKILPVGVAPTGAWRYSFVYDCTHRRYPDLPEKARRLSRRQARRQLVSRYLDAMGAGTVAEMRRLFGWSADEVATALDDLQAAAEACGGYRLLPGSEEVWVGAALKAELERADDVREDRLVSAVVRS
jgi:hypothetical protein